VAELKDTRHTILLAVPCDFDEFASRVGESDWLAKYRQHDDDPTKATAALRHWWDVEVQPMVAAPVVQLIASALELGVHVVRRATLADVRAATATSDVVVVFAHWKGYEFVADDLALQATPLAFMQRAAQSPTPLGRWLEGRLAALTGASPPITRPLDRMRALFRPQPPATLVELLGEALDVPLGDHRPDGVVDGILETPVIRLSRRRAEIDRVFNGLVQPGNRLELFDGMHSMEDLAAAIAPTFHGWLDLTTCTSVVLADHLLRAHRNAFRIVQFEKVQEPLWHAYCIRIALRLSARTEMNYAVARQAAYDTLDNIVRTVQPCHGERR
jgi:hypothetical protein